MAKAAGTSIWIDDAGLEVKRRRGEDDLLPDDSPRDSSSDDDSDDDDFNGISSDDSRDDDDSNDDNSSSSDDDSDDIVFIDGVAVKVRGDGSIDDSQPNGVRVTSNGLKLRGDGSIDDSQPDGVRILGTRRDDDLIGTGLFAESVAGRQGDDDFICGNRRSSFYLDRRGERETYMSIEDFGTGDNTVVCSGDKSDYKIAMTRVGGERGVGVYFRERQGKDLVAFLEDTKRNQLNSGDFNFLG